MERLGLWGTGTAFETFQDFFSMVNQNGLGAIEQLSMEMKSSGMYVSRGLSFQEAEFEPLKIKLDAQQYALPYPRPPPNNTKNGPKTAAMSPTRCSRGTSRARWSIKFAR